MSDASPTGRRPASRSRLDEEMVRRGLAETRTKAQGLILSGRVLVGDRIATKAGAPVGDGQAVTLKAETRRFASRGGEKLDGALDDLGISVEGVVALDVGASTGGFTDCLLRRGASRVYAVDVGEHLLADRLRRDPRVFVRDRVNFRYAPPDLIPEEANFATIDVSFISLRHILPPLRRFLRPGARVLALVKPQFEAGRESVGKGGVVRDEGKRRQAVRAVADFAATIGFLLMGEAESRLRGPKGNREVFLHLRWEGDPSPEGP